MLQNDGYCYIECQILRRKTVKIYQLTHDVYHHWLSEGVAEMFIVRQRLNE
jgi:hypothetical protein